MSENAKSITRSRSMLRHHRGTTVTCGAFGLHARKGNALVRGNTMDREGIEALIQGGITSFEAKTGVSLPWNLHKSHPLRGGSYAPQPYRAEVVEGAARFGGFLRAMAEFPALVAGVRSTQGHGTGSARTVVDLERLARRVGFNPGTLHRRVGAVQYRANEILAPFGVRVSLRKVLMAVSAGGTASTGKLAVIAAASRFGFVETQTGGASYRAAREFLRDVALARRAERNGGVVVDSGLIDAPLSIELSRAGFTVERTLRREVGCSNDWWYSQIVRKGEWVYHLPSWPVAAPAVLLKDGLKALRSQAAAAEAKAALAADRAEVLRDLAGQLQAEGPVDLVVYLSDSVSVGNCIPGTQAWMSRVGLAGRKTAPLSLVWAAADQTGDDRARRVVARVCESVRRAA